MLRKILLSPVCAACLFACFSFITQGSSKDDEAAIRTKSQAFVDAFNQRDDRALAALWTQNAQYIYPQTGEVLNGREEIARAYHSSFEQKPNAKIEFTIDQIIFPSSDKAIEAGTAIITHPGKEPTRTAYKAYYEKQHDEWLLTQVREVEFDFPPTSYDHLKQLEWLVGDWIDEDEDSKIVTSCKWDKYRNFLKQSFSLSVEGQITLEGMQIIAWDPVKKNIRSWMFDSDGTFGEASWKQEGKAWIIETAQTLANGERASAINTYTPVNQDSYTWESTGREVGGELLPDIAPVQNKRRKGEG